MNIESVILKFLAAEVQLQKLPQKLETARENWRTLLDKVCPGGDCPVPQVQKIYSACQEVEELENSITSREKEWKENHDRLVKVLKALNGKKLTYTYTLSSQQTTLDYLFWLEGEEVQFRQKAER